MANYWHGQWSIGTFYEGGADTAAVNGPDSYSGNVYFNLWGSDHTSSLDDKPETGANWTSYWQKIFGAFVGAWTVSTSYNYADWVTNGGSLYTEKYYGHTSSADNEPGVGANWTTYWTLSAIAPVIETDPWLGFALVGSLFIPVFYTVTLQGSLLVTDGDGKLVYRIGAFEEQHDGYDAIEDILGDAGVTFD